MEWRHAEFLNETFEGRRSGVGCPHGAADWELDYLIDWVFKQNGELDGRVGATGIDALKGVKSRHMSDPTAAEETKYGMLVAPNIAAIHHDHHFNFRLDMDVDGAKNRFVRNYYELEKLPESHPRGYVYVIREERPRGRRSFPIIPGRCRFSHFVVRARKPRRQSDQLRGVAGRQGGLHLPESEWYSKRANFLRRNILTPRPESATPGATLFSPARGTTGWMFGPAWTAMSATGMWLCGLTSE